MISPGLFAFLIVAALVLVGLTPLILVALWFADLKKGALW